ncbi:sigma-70 family RNA polymerase sigma factor [Actinomycetospora lutea]|uniref:RNA polymerase sigma factor n=1 Tax=Actinomycetospora lutea TaxID=663604 RepID=UPI002365E27C|nr:sigma-70 family RNA polymerase sigma factor [Actinomycetospora lutea]MDD7942636.1 sigma-70 family RNA polymerase sigma factor [Actinomycetospora lutea]
MTGSAVEDLLRRSAPQVLGALVRRHGQFALCEDAVQEALLAAATAWPRDGVPDEPVGWLVTVAGRRLTDLQRTEQARRRREDALAARERAEEALSDTDTDTGTGTDPADDTLELLLLCAHPALSEPSRIALTLRAVGGLRTSEIARAFLVPEATMAQRISRAKATIADAGFAPPGADRDARLASALHVLYVVFDEGYTATAGPSLTRVDLTAEAIRLVRRLHRLLPDDAEITGLLALMLLTDARRDARVGPDGRMLATAEQDRARWDHDAIAEATGLLERALATGPLGPYQLQAAIAAVHAEAPTDADTDWAQIVILYDLLAARSDNPVVTLNRAVAVGMAQGPRAGLDVLDTVADDPRLRRSHRPDAVRAHLLERLGDPAGAREHYRRAAPGALNQAEKRYLEERASRTSPPPGEFG